MPRSAAVFHPRKSSNHAAAATRHLPAAPQRPRSKSGLAHPPPAVQNSQGCSLVLGLGHVRAPVAGVGGGSSQEGGCHRRLFLDVAIRQETAMCDWTDRIPGKTSGISPELFPPQRFRPALALGQARRMLTCFSKHGKRRQEPAVCAVIRKIGKFCSSPPSTGLRSVWAVTSFESWNPIPERSLLSSVRSKP
jgi:hypothetical protein